VSGSFGVFEKNDDAGVQPADLAIGCPSLDGTAENDAELTTGSWMRRRVSDIARKLDEHDGAIRGADETRSGGTPSAKGCSVRPTSTSEDREPPDPSCSILTYLIGAPSAKEYRIEAEEVLRRSIAHVRAPRSIASSGRVGG
jgi:hypothetical protein